MLLISVRDNENNRWNVQKKPNKQTQRQKRTKANRNYSERVRAKWFYGAFKLGFLQLTCKAPLILSGI